MANELLSIKICPNEKKQLIPTSYQLHGETLAIEDASKYIVLSSHHQQPILGQTVRHINNIVGKGNKTLGFVRRNVKDCTKTVKAAAHTSVLDLQWNVPVYSLVLI